MMLDKKNNHSPKHKTNQTFVQSFKMVRLSFSLNLAIFFPPFLFAKSEFLSRAYKIIALGIISCSPS